MARWFDGQLSASGISAGAGRCSAAASPAARTVLPAVAGCIRSGAGGLVLLDIQEGDSVFGPPGCLPGARPAPPPLSRSRVAPGRAVQPAGMLLIAPQFRRELLGWRPWAR